MTAVDSFIDQLSLLSEEEREYKRLWEHNQSPPLPVFLNKEDDPIADITLRESHYFSDGRSFFHVEKHANYLPCYIHNHDFLEIEVVLRGRCLQEMDGKRFSLEEGDVIMVTPKQYHAVSVYDDATVLVNVLIPRHAFPPLFSPFASEKGEFSRYVSSLVRGKCGASALCLHGCGESFPSLVEAWQEGERSLALGQALISCFLARIALRKEEQVLLIAKDGKRDARMGAILHYIQENPDKVSLKTLSYAFSMTPAYMSALIHKNTGRNFSDLLSHRRMELVLQLLEEYPRMPLAKVAKEVGYESVQQLCRLFRKHYHLTPTQWKRRREREG